MPLHSLADFHPAWGNLWAPPLLFRRRPPQSNCLPDTVPLPDNGIWLEPRSCKSGISTTTPYKLTSIFHSLPPILHMQNPNSMSSYSKAPWGLSVLVWVSRIFTANPISPSPSLRQLPNRYAFRAGQNLPDKEFRYLRTVIVTAAVHRGFISELALHHLTFRHRAGVSPYTSSYDLAETCVFDKQSLLPILCHQSLVA